jgi:hypothetical protein
VLIEQKIIIRWQNFQIKFTIPTDQLVGRFSRNFFSRTAEGIELKSGIYVPMNVFNMCCYCWHHLKIQNGHQRRSKFALKPYGKQHFHHLLENSRTEFNQSFLKIDQLEFSKSYGGYVF